MRLSNREKVLITILVILVGYLTYTYAPINEFFNLSLLEEEHIQKKNDYDTMLENILSKSIFEEKVSKLTAEINELNVVSDLQQEYVIIFLNNYLKDNNIEANDISFTESSVVTMSPFQEARNQKQLSSFEILMNDIKENSDESETNISEDALAEEASSENQAGTLSVEQISVNINFESNYDSMLNFIDAIQNNPVDISIINISVQSLGEDLLQGNMVLNFYQVPKLDGYVETNRDWIWNDLLQSGKTNPFKEGDLDE